MYQKLFLSRTPPSSHSGKFRRITVTFLALGWFFGFIAEVWADSHTFDLSFETTNQGMWGPGNNATFETTQEIINVPWDVGPLNLGGITEVTVPVVSTPVGDFGGQSLGDFGASSTSSTSGNAGLNFRAGFDPGSVDVSYPVRVSLDVPDQSTLSPGQSFTISSSYEILPGASMNTVIGEGRLAFDGFANIDAFQQFQVAFGTTQTTTPVDFSGGTYTELVSYASKDSVGITSDDIESMVGGFGATLASFGAILADVPPPDYNATAEAIAAFAPNYGFEALSGSTPDINTSGVLVGNSLHSMGADPGALSLTWDLDGLMSDLLPFPVGEAAGLLFEGDFTPFGANASYNVLDVDTTASVGAAQDFLFDPTVIVSLDLGNGQAPIEFEAGESVTITLPEEGGIHLTPTFRLDNWFTNTTDIAGDASLTVEALQAAINVVIPDVDIAIPTIFQPFLGTSIDFPIPDVNVNGGPVLTETTRAPWAAPAFSDTWELQGFQQFSGDSIFLIPEPSSFALAGIGLVALLTFSRRRRIGSRRRSPKSSRQGFADRSNKRSLQAVVTSKIRQR